MSLPSPVASDNMHTPILQIDVSQYNIDQQLSMYIPYVSADGEYIKNTIEDYGFGKVKRIDCVARGNDDSTSMAFIHMEYWEDNALVENFQERIKSSDKEARIVYDDPNYWIILPNKNPLNFDVNEKINNMQTEIDILRNENEEFNKKVKNLQWFINLHDANIEYLCKKISELDTKNTKTFLDEYHDNVVFHKKKRIRSSPLDNTCGCKSDSWEPSSSPNVKNIWTTRLRPRVNGMALNPLLYSEC